MTQEINFFSQVDNLKSAVMLENANFIWKAAVNGLF